MTTPFVTGSLKIPNRPIIQYPKKIEFVNLGRINTVWLS